MRLVRTSVRPLMVVFAMLSLLLAGCGGQAAVTPAGAPTQATAAPAAAQPTAAPQATADVVPTNAPEPTVTREPTAVPAPTQAPAATETVVAAPAGGDALDLLLNAMRAQLAQKAWRTTATVDDAGTVSTVMLEFVAPGSMHMDSGAGQEFIILKEGTYQRNAGGTWQKLDFDMSSMVASFLDPKSVEEMMADLTVDKLKFLGPDLIGGKPMWVYQYASKMKVGEQTIDSTAKVWIGVLDKLPHKGESEGNSIMSPGKKTKSSVVYEYGPDIKVEAPTN